MADNINDILRAKRLVRQAGYRVEKPALARPTSRFSRPETTEEDRPSRLNRFDRTERSPRFDREERTSRFDRPERTSRFDRPETDERKFLFDPYTGKRLDGGDAEKPARRFPPRPRPTETDEPESTPAENDHLSDRMKLIKAKQIVKAAGYSYQKFNTGVDDEPPKNNPYPSGETVGNDGLNTENPPEATLPQAAPEAPATAPQPPKRVRPSAPVPREHEIEVVPGKTPEVPAEQPKRKSAEEYYQELAAKYV